MHPSLSDEDDSDDEKSVGQVVVEGCGTANANGTYKKGNKTHGGAPIYVHRREDSNEFVICRTSGKWYIERRNQFSDTGRKSALVFFACEFMCLI